MTNVAPIVRTLNGVRSVGQAQAAAGEALKFASRCYKLLPRLPGEMIATSQRALDAARLQVEDGYRKLGTVKTAAAGAAWAPLRKAIERLYIEGSAVEVTAAYHDEIDTAGILADAVVNAPGVFLETVGSAAGKTLATAGNAAGAGLGALFSGLGIWGPILGLAAAAFVLVKLGLLQRLVG